MRTYTLQEMRLQNFQGVKDFTLSVGGKPATVFGANARGKTTLANAFRWLLTGEDTAGRADFGIKTVGQDGEVKHGLDHTVSGMFRSDDGAEMSFTRTYREKWTKKRGAGEREFTGHETLFEVDGVPVQKGEYQRMVAAMADEETIKLLSDPMYFSERLHWQKRRNLLIDICGDVPLATVIEATPGLAGFAEVLGKRTPEDAKKVAQHAAAELNREMETLPARMDEVERQIPAAPPRKESEIRTDIAAADAELETAKNSDGGQVARRRTAELETQISEYEAQLQQTVAKSTGAAVEAVKNRKAAADAELNRQQLALNILKTSVDDGNRSVSAMNQRLQAMRDEYDRIEATAYQSSDVPETCAACGQALPADKVAAAREKSAELMAKFNADKQRRLEAIQSDGKALKQQKEALESQVADNAAKMAEHLEARDRAQAELVQATADVIAVQEQPEPAEAQALRDTIAELQRMVGTLRTDSSTGIKAQADAIHAANEKLNALRSELAGLETRRQLLARKKELEARKDEVAAEYEAQQQIIAMVDLYTRRRAEMLEGAINSTFKVARFRLFKQQINGGLDDCLDTMVDGVLYSDLNHAAKVQVGLDIIEAVGHHLGVRLPLWVDQRESVTELPAVSAQVIDLVVDAAAKKLKVVVTE